MLSNRKNYFVSRLAFSAVVIFVALLVAPTLQAGPAQEAGTVVYAQLINERTDPTLRYPVAIHFGPAIGGRVSRGWLEVSREKVRYQPVVTSGWKGQEFEDQRGAVTVLKFSYGSIEVNVAGKKRSIRYEPSDKWEKGMEGMSVPEQKAFFKTMYAATTEIQKALENFDAELQEVRAKSKGRSPNASL